VVPSLADTRRYSESMVEEKVIGLFDELRIPLLRYLAGFPLTLQDSEDVIQEVFLALFQSLRSGKSHQNVRGWLFRVAHNLALKRRTRTRQDLPVDDTVIEPGPNPEDQLLRSQIRVRLMAVVKALPEQDRECLFLRAEGLRYREIAGILDMSLGAVSLSLARSLARIARAAER